MFERMGEKARGVNGVEAKSCGSYIFVLVCSRCTAREYISPSSVALIG